MTEKTPIWIKPLAYVGEVASIFLGSIHFLLKLRLPLKLTLEQMSLIGVNSLVIVLLTNTFTGMVIALQTAQEMSRYGAGQFVGGMVAVAMARELAPALTGVVVAGRAGSAIAAEIGTMTVTEQIDAMKAMAVSPLYYLVLPRLLACLLMLPVLTVFANVFGIGGGYFVSVFVADINPNDFFRTARMFLRIKEVVYGLMKSSCFGAIVSLVACHQGLTATQGAFGVGKATTNAVVLAMVFIFAANYFLSALMFGGRFVISP